MWINLTEAQTQFLIKAGGKLQKEGVGKQERGVSIRAMAKLERARHDSYGGKDNDTPRATGHNAGQHKSKQGD
jgi:hypothetical protein